MADERPARGIEWAGPHTNNFTAYLEKVLLGVMHIRQGNPGDASAVASLIAGFQPILTLEPGGAGAEQYLESPRNAYLAAAHHRSGIAFLPMRLILRDAA